MTESCPTEDYNDVKKEVEEIDLERMEAEAKKSKERDEVLRTFEDLSHRLESGKSWFDIPPPPPPPQRSKIENDEAFLSYIRERFQKADPKAKQEFADKIEGVDFDVKPTQPQSDDQEYFVSEESKEFGLTKGDYEFLLSDIGQGIIDGNKKYGFGEAGTIDRSGNFYPFADTDKPRRIKKSKFKYKPVFATAVSEKKIGGMDSNGR